VRDALRSRVYRAKEGAGDGAGNDNDTEARCVS
jgi:hypothetical protein